MQYHVDILTMVCVRVQNVEAESPELAAEIARDSFDRSMLNHLLPTGPNEPCAVSFIRDVREESPDDLYTVMEKDDEDYVYDVTMGHEGRLVVEDCEPLVC